LFDFICNLSLSRAGTLFQIDQHHVARRRAHPYQQDGRIPEVSLAGRSVSVRIDVNTESRRFYNSPVCSDIKLKFSRLKGVVHAHKVILAAGSGYFDRKHQVGLVRYSSYSAHQLIFYQEGEAAEWEIVGEDTTVMKAAIRYMYGFEFLGEGGHRDLGSIAEFAEVGRVAEKYEIAGLPEFILTAASRALDDCISNEAKLGSFLNFGRQMSLNPGQEQRFNYAVKIIGDKVAELSKHDVFQELLDEEPELAVALVNLWGERQSRMQEGNGDLK